MNPYVALLSCTLVLTGSAGVAQNTVGLISYDPALSYEGYTMVYPVGQGTVYLLNNCGQVVQAWPDTAHFASNSARLMDDGTMQRLAITPGYVSPMMAGGGGQYVQRKAWDNTITWMWEYSDATVRAHHDACVLPNGNTLVVAWEWKTAQEAWDAGRDTTGFGYTSVWPDHIVEVEPSGLNTGNIVWEWHAWDHLVQDFNPLADNFGVPADHPELIDINYDEALNPDWLHINYIEYNPVLDQIVMSVPHFNELWVIDHSTTTAEAVGHTGGNSGRGGDLLYRWGNPLTYRLGTALDQKLNFNHGTAWVDKEAQWGDPNFGRIIVFNNRLGAASSAVDIIDTPVDSAGHYAYQQGTIYGPAAHSWRYEGDPPPTFFSSGLSNAQVLPNGNVLICSGRQGRLFEVDTAGTVVWEYENPVVSGQSVAQGTVPPALGNQLFHTGRYSPDHPGLQGHLLDPIGYIELSPDTDFCNMPMALAPPVEEDVLTCLVQGDVLVVLGLGSVAVYDLYDATGRAITSGTLRTDRDGVALSGLRTGVYVLRLHGHGVLRFALQR